MHPTLVRCAIVIATASAALAAPTAAKPASKPAVSDSALVRRLPGFSNQNATINGVRLHYVVGGAGSPVFLLPGWPETWWSYHKIMPALAKTHRVYAIDLRGMGSSEKPPGGYDKKTMASDLSALAQKLGHSKVDVIGHDIGAMVAFSFAANHGEQVARLVLLDVGHPSNGYLSLKLLPDPGSFGDKADEDHVYLWWFAFHQVKGLPEALLEGRAGIEQAWFFHYMAKDEAAIDPLDRAVYAAAYSTRDGTRAGNGGYQAFGQDIIDYGTYGPLSMPVLGLGGPGFKRLKAQLDTAAPGSRTYRVEGSGHFIAEERPAETLRYLTEFLGSK